MISPAHPDVLALLATLPETISDYLEAGTSLRQHHSPDVVAAALTQHELRRHATAKFGEDAATMLFTRDGLEQASRRAAADYHASVFTAAGITTVREVGPGIGGDTLAFARAGLTVDARDLDSERIELARHNLAGKASVTLSVCDGLADVTSEGLWADPARRGPRGRIANPEQWSPPLSAVFHAASHSRLTGIKVAPGIAYRDLPSHARVDWIGEGPDLLEAIIWLGDVTPGRRGILLGGPTIGEDLDPSSDPVQVPPRELGRYLYDPHPALLRSGCLHLLCGSDCAPVAPKVGYLTSDRLVDSPWLQAFEIIDVLPLKAKAIARRLAEDKIGTVDIKKRGVDITPEALRARLKVAGNQSATLVLTPTVEGRRCLLVSRHESTIDG